MDRFIIHTTGLATHPSSISIYDRLFKNNVLFQLTTTVRQFEEEKAWIIPHCDALNRLSHLEGMANLETLEDAKLFIEAMELRLGAGFHPDTPIGDYVNNGTARPSFPIGQQTILQRMLDQCFDLFGAEGEDAIYNYSLEVYQRTQKTA